MSSFFVIFSADLFRNKLFHDPIKLVGFQKRRSAPGDKYKVAALEALLSKLRLQSAECLSYHSSGAAPLNGAAHLFRGDYAQAVDTALVGAKVTHKGIVYNAFSFFEQKAELTVLFNAYIVFGVIHSLVRKSFSALGTSSGKHLSAVAGSHSFSEAVFHLSLTLLGLVCSLHFRHSFPIIVFLFFPDTSSNQGAGNGRLTAVKAQ